MAKIFLSYSHADRPYLDRLHPIMGRAFPQHQFWFDDQITGGDDWERRIFHEVSTAEIFLFLLSNDSLTSNYCHTEFKEALRLNKPCLPVIIRPKTDIDTAPPEIATELRRLQWIDLSDMFADSAAMATLFAALDKVLDTLPDRSAGKQPITTGRTAYPSPKLRRVPPMAYLAVLGIALVVIAFLIVQSLTQDDSGSPVDVAMTTPQPTTIHTQPPTATATLVPSPTDTPIPPTSTSAPMPFAPVWIDDFNSNELHRRWGRWALNPTLDDGLLKFNGVSRWDHGTTTALHPNEAIRFRFQYEGADSVMNFTVQYSEYPQSDRRTWGFALSDRYWEIITVEGADPDRLLRSVRLKENTWYDLLLSVSDDNRFMTAVWESYASEPFVLRIDEPMGEDWNRPGWNVNVNVYLGVLRWDEVTLYETGPGYQLPDVPPCRDC